MLKIQVSGNIISVKIVNKSVSNNQLSEKISLLKRGAIQAGQNIIFNFTKDGGSVIAANKQTRCIGLFSMTKGDALACYLVDIARWNWAHEEGFSRDEIASTEIRKEVFRPITSNDLIRKLIGE